MSRQMPFDLTDSLIERMLEQQAGAGAPMGLVLDIVTAVEATPQRRAGVLPHAAWPTGFGRRQVRLLVAVALLASLLVGAALVGSLLLRRPVLTGGGPLIVYQARGAYADVFTLDLGTGERSQLESVQLTAKIGGQRIVWGADGRHAFVFGDGSRLSAVVDLATGQSSAVNLSAQGARDEVSPASDRVARLVGDEEQGMRLSVVDMAGAELVNIPLPAGLAVSEAIAWSPDESSVALAAGGQLLGQLLLVPLDGSPIRQLTPDTGGNVGSASFSPDGSTVAYSSLECSEQCSGGISTVRVADGLVTQLTASGPDVAWLTWSPDGGRIAFQRGGGEGGIYVIDRDGGNLTRLTTAPGAEIGDRNPIWSPDGTLVAFTRDVSDTSLGDLWVVPSSGGEALPLVDNATADWGPATAQVPPAPSATASPAASAPAQASASTPAQATAAPVASNAPTSSAAPAGSRPLGGGPLLVWQLDGLSGADAKTETVYTIDVGTGLKTTLGTLPVTESTCCPTTVQWSADRRHAFLSALYLQAIVDLDTGTLDRVKPPPAGQFKEAISRQGDRIARVDEVTGTAPTVVVSDLDGKAITRLEVPGVRGISELSWSPDGTALAANGVRPSGKDPELWLSHVLIVPVDGSPPREIANQEADVVAPPPTGSERWDHRVYLGPAWSPDGKTIALADWACMLEPSREPDNPSDNRLPQTCTGRLLIIDVASGERTVLTGDLAPGRPSWSPDGLRLAFGRASADGSDPAIYVIDRDGANLTRLADGDGPADWSPDGTWLEFNRLNWDLPRGTDHAEVWVVPAGGGKALRIAAPAAAAWSVGWPIE